MIIGTGIDIVSAQRFKSWDAGLCARWFHQKEIIAVKEKGEKAYLSLAARFAAKEAYGKALGTGLRGIFLRDIELVQDSKGKPFLKLHRTAQRALDAVGENCVVHLSLAHDGDLALAQVLIEERKE